MEMEEGSQPIMTQTCLAYSSSIHGSRFPHQMVDLRAWAVEDAWVGDDEGWGKDKGEEAWEWGEWGWRWDGGGETARWWREEEEDWDKLLAGWSGLGIGKKLVRLGR
jgi:hypothetical protein